MNIAPGSTTAALLDTTKADETVRLEVVYNDGGRQESAVYEFRIIKNPELETNLESTTADTLDYVQEFVDSVAPDNEKVDQAISGVFGAIDNISGQVTGALPEDILSTYSTYIEQAGEVVTGDYDFDYLGQLLSNVYETDVYGNVVTTRVYTTTEETTTEAQSNVVQIVTQAVAENPEIVAAPTGLIALGGLLGFMMNKKHRGKELFAENYEDEDE